jgi:hypothetical protein
MLAILIGGEFDGIQVPDLLDGTQEIAMVDRDTSVKSGSFGYLLEFPGGVHLLTRYRRTDRLTEDGTVTFDLVN